MISFIIIIYKDIKVWYFYLLNGYDKKIYFLAKFELSDFKMEQPDITELEATPSSRPA